MRKNKKGGIICIIILIILILLCIILYKIQNQAPKKISKLGAEELCKYIVYNKIDNNLLVSDLKDITSKQKGNSTEVELTFIHSQSKYNKLNYTKAYCNFNNEYINNKEILLKKFFYKDINNIVYMYINTYIYVVLNTKN